ncbi:hypothetical protein M0812_23144 [Anaeramoeba flamelloides]|uniref:Ras-GAP domain-containing protein n=1 Tax=Anaeramoeba flamelloides TaxID=1746091 RepID=A0AAV7YR24_9EUKA|nr:hypothetical protein M0812_23144 [Anaeramoeba flamelloides]
MSKLSLFKQSVREKISTVKKSELSSDFFTSGLQQSKEMKKHLTDLISKTKQYSSSMINDIKSQHEFIKTYRLFSKTILNEEGEIEIQKCLVIVAEISTKLLHLQEQNQEQLSKILLKHSQQWLDVSYKDLTKTKKEYEKLRKQFDSSHTTLINYLKKKEQDPKRKITFEAESEVAKEKLQRISGELYFKIDEIVGSKDVSSLEMITNALNRLKAYYYEGYTAVYDSFEYIGQIKEKVKNMLNQFNSENRERDMKTLSNAQEDDETKFDSLVMCLSALDQATISSLIVATASDKDILASLIKIFEAYGETRSVLQNCIIKEVEKTQSSAQLFRENTTSTKLTSSFTNIIGHNYRKNTLLPLIKWMQDNPRGYECNPNKCPENENPEENIQHILETSQMFLDAIIDSIDQVPLPIRCICHDLRKAVKKRFPEQELQSVGGYIFLRYLCPGISNFKVSGVQEELETQPDKVLFQTALMVTRLLQSLANGSYFDKKRPELKGLNVFIDNNKSRIKTYFNQISTIPENKDYTPIASLDEVKKKDLPVLHQTICDKIDLITKKLHSNKDKVPVINLFKSLKLIGPPLTVPEKKKKK